MMSTRWMFLIAAQIASTQLLSTLVPQPPVPISNTITTITPVSSAGSSSAYIAAWIRSSTDVVASASTNQGSSWSSPVTIATNGIRDVKLAAKANQFVACWNYQNEGSNQVRASTTTDLGQSWSAGVPISPLVGLGSSVFSDVGLAAANAGFMAVWIDVISMPDAVWGNFSSNGSTWGTPFQVTTTGTATSGSGPSIAGNNSGFLVVYNQGATTGYATFSSNQGLSWSTPVLVISDLKLGTELSLASNDSGFLVTWIDSSEKAFSAYAGDGIIWSSPSLIAEDIFDNMGRISVTVSAVSGGFVVAWIDQNQQGYASFSSNQGTTWSAPVLVTGGNQVGVASTYEFIGVGAFQNNCMFTWNNDSSNLPFSAFSTIFTDSTQTSRPFIKQITPNKPGQRFF